MPASPKFGLVRRSLGLRRRELQARISSLGMPTPNPALIKPRSEKFPPTAVIFSKDRPLQLDGLLESMDRFVGNSCSRVVLYCSSDPLFQESYADLSSSRRTARTAFVQQRPGSFRENLLQILEGVRSPQIFFLVDDQVFIRPVDLGTIASYCNENTVPSLRLGLNIRYSFMSGRPQRAWGVRAVVGEDPPEIDLWCWTWGKGLYDWGYPLCLDGNFFMTHEIINLAHALDFSGPNSFETALQQFTGKFASRTGLCLRQSVVVNLPDNRVQDEVVNVAGSGDPRELLSLYRLGYRMDVAAFGGHIPDSPHEMLELRVHKN